MADLFVALGYEQPRLNVHKSGRELDLVRPPSQRRRAIGECKATADTIGGDDLNKFVGVLDAKGQTTSLDRLFHLPLRLQRNRHRTGEKTSTDKDHSS